MPFVGTPGPFELLIIGMIALLLFGKRLPEVARNLGKGIVEFKKGVRGIEDEVETATYQTASTSNPRPAASHDDHSESTAPKFEPPAAAPTAAGDAEQS